ncbi:MAG: hypothetical protein SGI90_08920 [Candidatus Eisenbacteria bacterium]|nr:hypothetical protein [Candidatus Eisenbacteria bacterium]
MSGDVGHDGDAGGSADVPRILTENELAAHYARERRKEILAWIGGGVAVLVLMGVLAWQILRPER